MDLIQTLESTYKKEIKELNKQLYTQFQKNKELQDKITYLEEP